jgi:tight adherence protein B
MIWLFSILAFLFVASLVMAIYGFINARHSPEQAMRKRLAKLNPSSESLVQRQIHSLMREETLSTIPLLDRLLGFLPKATDLKLLLERAGQPFNLGTLVLMCALAGAIGLFVGVWRQDMLLSLVLCGLGASLPIMYLRVARGRRLAAFDEQFPDAVDLMSRALRAGHSFTSAMRMISEEMEAPVAEEFRRCFEDYSFGKSLNDALNAMVERVGLQDLKFFATAVMLQRETGGNLTEILDNIGYIIRERFRLLRQVKALSAEGRLSATVLTLVPPLLMLTLWIVSPKYLDPLFNDERGKMMLIIGAAFQVIGIIVIKRLTKLTI